MADEEESTKPSVQIPFQNPMGAYGASILTLTNPDNELYKMELSFRSARLNQEGEKITYGEPLMNDLGINSVLGQTQAIVNQVTIMGNLEKRELPMLIDFLADTLAKDLMINRVEYGITNPSARRKIFFMSLTTAYLCMKRAFQEGDRRFWKGSQHDIRQTIVNDGSKKGILARMNPWGKK